MSIYYQDDQTTVYHGDCIEVMRNLPESSVDAIVTDPPYGLGFMGAKWDALPPGKDWAEECLRVLKPGGHLLAFGGTRTWHRLAVAIEDAGFEIRDSVMWLYGSGFPKSHDVSKAIDKAAGHVRGSAPDFRNGPNTNPATKGTGRHGGGYGIQDGTDTGPATPEAVQWSGWGTALKPANEPIVMARKPFKGTVAANVLEHGTGAINIDACRIDSEPRKIENYASKGPEGMMSHGFGGGNGHAGRGRTARIEHKGRWPANVILNEHTAQQLDQQSGVLKSGALTPTGREKKGYVYGLGHKTSVTNTFASSEGGASRFFYIARKDNECPSGQSSSTVSTAEMSSSGEGQPPASAPNDAATSERHDTGKQTDSPSTNGTQNGSKPNEKTDTPTTPTIESVSSPERQHASTTLTRNPANSAEPNPQTDTMTTTTSHLKSAGSAESATSSTTQKSKELGDMDLGDSSRFMYCAKAPKRERPEVNGVKHATVKPLTLMRYLVRMVTPPGGIVLDPFVGSGTTIEAALLEGFQSIGIELTDEYLPLIQQRIQRQEVIE